MKYYFVFYTSTYEFHARIKIYGYLDKFVTEYYRNDLYKISGTVCLSEEDAIIFKLKFNPDVLKIDFRRES